MTEREYIAEQARLRSIGDKEGLKKLVDRYAQERPPITGTFVYTQKQVDEAKKAGF